MKMTVCQFTPGGLEVLPSGHPESPVEHLVKAEDVADSRWLAHDNEEDDDDCQDGPDECGNVAVPLVHDDGDEHDNEDDKGENLAE